MHRRIASIALGLILITEALSAAPVSSERARVVGANALVLLRSHAGLAPLPSTSAAAAVQGEMSDHPLLYIITLEDGFAIISGDDVAPPLLGYGLGSSINSRGSLPSNIRTWLDGYRAQIRRAVEQSKRQGAETRAAWEELERGDGRALASSDGAEVAPLLKTTWDQYPYYNALCPFDSTANQGTMAGCVATAMAQVMKYWNYPEQGEGFYSYAHDVYGTLPASFASTTYRWDEMPDTVNAMNDAVATLIYHCGVATQMEYSPIESLTSVIEISTPPLKMCAETALERFFRYDPASVHGVLRSDYTTEFWPVLLRSELDSARPIIYDGFGDGGGHCFVVDGYQENYFHINWGWSGSFNGYFLLDALNPDSAGVGDDGFNVHQEAIIGIKPLAQNGQGLELNAEISLPLSINHNGAIHTATDVVNRGSTLFHGDLCVAAFDSTGAFVDYAGLSRNLDLAAGASIPGGLTLDTSKVFRLLPGTYTVAVCSRPAGGEWSILPSTPEHTNSRSLTVLNPSSLALDRAISVAAAERLEHLGVLDATANLRNEQATEFRGSIGMKLYALDGSEAETIGWQENLVAAPGAALANDLHFNDDTLNAGAGTYLVALVATAEGSGDTVLVASGSYSNPLPVIVQTFARDIYEPNDKLADAAPLPVSATGGTVVTSRANIHIANDTDWYRLPLPPNGTYTVRARVQDRSYHDDGNSYSNDVLFHVIHRGDTSEEYDSTMRRPLTVDGGDTLFFLVAAYFDGDRGNYTLEIEVNGPSAVATESDARWEMHPVPNPATSEVRLSLPPTSRSVDLIDARGIVLRTMEINERTGSTLRIPLDGIPAGWYTLRVRTADGEYRTSMMKAK